MNRSSNTIGHRPQNLQVTAVPLTGDGNLSSAHAPLFRVERPLVGLLGSHLRKWWDRGTPAFAQLGWASKVFAVLLVCAAILKAQALVEHDIRSLESVFYIAECILEWVLAVWLLSEVAKRWALISSVILLVMFLSVATAAFVRGEPDCGCFGGHIRIPPLFTALLDAALLSAIIAHSLYQARHSAGAPSAAVPRAVRLGSAFAVAIALSIAAWLFAASLAQAANPNAGDPIVFNAAEWAHQPFPLLPYVVPSSHDLRRGRWHLIIFDHTCGHCIAYLNERHNLGFRRDAAMIDIAHSDDGGPTQHLDHRIPVLRIVKAKDVVVDVPIEVELKDGVVEEVEWPTLPSAVTSLEEAKASGERNY